MSKAGNDSEIHKHSPYFSKKTSNSVCPTEAVRGIRVSVVHDIHCGSLRLEHDDKNIFSKKCKLIFHKNEK